MVIRLGASERRRAAKSSQADKTLTSRTQTARADRGPFLSVTAHSGVGCRRRARRGEAQRDALAQFGGHVDALQFLSDGEEHALLERVLAGAGGACLEMRPHTHHLARAQLAVEIVVDPAKDFFAGVAIQW